MAATMLGLILTGEIDPLLGLRSGPGRSSSLSGTLSNSVGVSGVSLLIEGLGSSFVFALLGLKVETKLSVSLFDAGSASEGASASDAVAPVEPERVMAVPFVLADREPPLSLLPFFGLKDFGSTDLNELGEVLMGDLLSLPPGELKPGPGLEPKALGEPERGEAVLMVGRLALRRLGWALAFAAGAVSGLVSQRAAMPLTLLAFGLGEGVLADLSREVLGVPASEPAASRRSILEGDDMLLAAPARSQQRNGSQDCGCCGSELTAGGKVEGREGWWSCSGRF